MRKILNTKFMIEDKRRFFTVALITIAIIGISTFYTLAHKDKIQNIQNNLNNKTQVNVNYIRSQHDIINNIYNQIPNKEKIDNLLKTQNELKYKVKTLIENIDKFKASAITYTISFYNLGVRSTGKTKVSRGYGITRTGYDLKGKTWREARVIAVDPRVIPLNSQVLIEFEDEEYKKFNGIYNAADTGSAVKGRVIDLFLDKSDKECFRLGLTKAKVTIIKRGTKK